MFAAVLPYSQKDNMQQESVWGMAMKTHLVRKWIATCAVAMAALITVPQAMAVPIAGSQSFGELLDVPASITFNVHNEGLVGGDPAPIYVQDGLELINGPASAVAEVVGNACIRVSWGNDNPDSIPFDIQYSLVAGDRTFAPDPGNIRIERGNGQLTNVTDIVNGCDDPNNTPPVAGNAAFNFPANTSDFSFFVISPDGPAFDADGLDTLRLTNEACWTQPQNGTVSRDIENPFVIRFTPATGFTEGTDSFEYCVTDNPRDPTTGPRGTITFTLQSSGPTAQIVDDEATAEQLEFIAIDVLANDILPFGIGNIVSVSMPTEGGFANVLSAAECAQQIPGIETQCVGYSSPSSDMQGNPFFGTDTFTYTVGGADNPIGVGTVTVTVLPPTPVVADDTATTPSETAIDIDVRANDSPGFGETITVVSSPASGGSTQILSPQVCATIFPNSNEQCIRYTPPFAATGEPPFSGDDTFTYTVSVGGVSSTATVTVTVEEPVQTTREAVPDTGVTTAQVARIFDVLANDTLIPGDFIESVTTPASGATVEILDQAVCANTIPGIATQCLRYTPPGRDNNGVLFTGDDNFTYVAGDGDTSVSAGVTITVALLEGSPEPIADDVSDANAGETTVIDVLANDLFAGGAETLIIVAVTDPANGTVEINTNPDGADTVSYTPNEGFIGTDSFFYTVSDGDSDTQDQAAEVRVTVSAPGGRNRLSSLALTPEELEVATAIDSVCDNLQELFGQDDLPPTPPPVEKPTAEQVGITLEGQQALLERCTALIDLANPVDGSDNTAQVRDALRQISGEEVFAQATISTQILNTQIKNIDSRLAALRGGVTGINVQGLALNIDGKALPNGLFGQRRGGGASADETDEDDRGQPLLADSRLGLFMNGRLNFGDIGATATENGFDFETLGVTAGADYRFRNDLAIGAAIGYANADVDYNNTGGATDADSLTYTVYGTYFTDRIYIDVLAGTGGIDFDSFRTLRFDDGGSGVDTTALGVTEGDQTIISANFGYNIERNGWLFVPFLGYDYINTQIDSFGETSGAGWELAFDEQDVKSQIISGGLRLAYNKSVSFGVIVPHLRVALQQELETDQRVLTARFVNDPSNTRFRFFTDGADSSFFQLATGVSMVLENGLSGFIDYETITGYSNLKSSTLTMGLRFERRFK